MTKILDTTIKAAIVILTLALVWFAFIYYPQVVNKLRAEAKNGGFVTNVRASSSGLPYQNNHIKIEYIQSQNVYKVTIIAQTMDQYTQYKTESDLALKNILSLDNLCSLTITYESNLSFVSRQTQKGC